MKRLDDFLSSPPSYGPYEGGDERKSSNLFRAPTELIEHNLITKISSKCITIRVDNRRSVSNWRLGVVVLGSTLSLLCYSLMR